MSARRKRKKKKKKPRVARGEPVREDAVRECPPDTSENDDVLRDDPSLGSGADVGGDPPETLRRQVKQHVAGDDRGRVGAGHDGHVGRRSGRTTPDVSTGARH